MLRTDNLFQNKHIADSMRSLNKVQKMNIEPAMSIDLSLRMFELQNYFMDFAEVGYFDIYNKICWVNLMFLLLGPLEPHNISVA
jgi:hypothetical protein